MRAFSLGDFMWFTLLMVGMGLGLVGDCLGGGMLGVYSLGFESIILFILF